MNHDSQLNNENSDHKRSKRKKGVIILLSMIALLGIIFIGGRINISILFHKEVKELFARSKPMLGKRFNQEQLIGLPEPVQRYFRLILKENQSYISYARITHDGQFKTGLDKDWVNISGEQYATTSTPGFIWKGTTFLFTARDMYIANKGQLTVSLFSLVTVVDAKGETYNQGELLRWLGESILYPTNFLPDERLEWSPIDNHTARVNFNYNGLSLFFIVTFNDIGEIIEMETKRYMDDKTLETWIIKTADYKEINNILLPTHFEVLWRLPKGDFSYAKFNLKKVEYDNPSTF